MTLRQTLASLPRDARDTLFLLFVIVWVITPQVSNLPVWTSVLAGGLRTADIMQTGMARVGTSVMGEAVVRELDKLSA